VWALTFAYGLSSLGDELAIITLMMRAERDTGSGWLVSGVLVAAFAPVVLAGPLIAPLIDRVDRAKLVRAVSLAQAAAAGVLAWLSGPVPVLALVAVIATGTAVVTPALLALIPSIYGEDRAAHGYGRLEAARNVGTVAGPALAGVLLAAGNARLALLADAASFIIIAVCLPAKQRAASPTLPRQQTWLEQVRAGVAIVYRDPVLRRAALSLLVAVLFSTIANTALVFYSAQTLHSGPATYGWLVAAQATGSFLVAAKLVPALLKRGHTPLLLAATLMLGLSRLLLGWFPALAVAIGACIIAGACVTAQNLALRDLVRDRVPQDRRGRAFASVGSLLTSANILGTAAGGPLATGLGAVNALAISGFGTIAAGSAAIAPLARRHTSTPAASQSPIGVTDQEPAAVSPPLGR